MLPNSAFYGEPETWLNATTKPNADDSAANKIPSYSTINGGISNGYLNVDTALDNTICYACIANDSPIASISCIQNSDYNNPIYEYNDIINFFWGYVDTQSTLYNTNRTININNLSDTNYADRIFLTPQMQNLYPSDNVHGHFVPYVAIVPNNFVLIVQITCVDINYSNPQTMALQSYIDNTYNINPSTHPYITAVSVVPCGGDTINTTTRSNLAINNNGGVALAYDLMLDLSSVSNISSAIDYWSQYGVSKNAVCIWGHITSIAYNNIYQYYHGTGGEYHTNNGGQLVYARSYGNGEWVLQCAASLGLFFTPSSQTAYSAALTDTNMYLGLIDDDGLCHGDYTRGADNANQKQYSWTNTNDSEYNPKTPIDPNTYDNTTVFNYIGSLSTMLKRYVLDARGVASLGNDLFKIGDDIVTGAGNYVDYDNIILNNFLTNNPIDAIISLKKYPVKDIPHVGNLNPLKLGKVTIATTGYDMPYSSFMYLFKPITVFPRFGNSFLDYAPYTTLELYIPFCGTVQLDPNDVMGHSIDVQLLVDYTTGSCDAFISCDNLVIETVSGTLAIDIPVTGTESATVDSNLTQGILSAKSLTASRKIAPLTGAMKTAGGAVAGGRMAGPAGAVAGAGVGMISAAKSSFDAQLSSAAADYELTHTEAPLRVIAAASPVGAWAIDFSCRLIISYPTGSIISSGKPPEFDKTALSKFGHLHGFACLISDKLSKFNGFTIGDINCNSISVNGVSPTAEEITLIKNAMKEGCYL